MALVARAVAASEAAAKAASEAEKVGSGGLVAKAVEGVTPARVVVLKAAGSVAERAEATRAALATAEASVTALVAVAAGAMALVALARAAAVVMALERAKAAKEAASLHCQKSTAPACLQGIRF